MDIQVQLSELEKRLARQESLHRNVGEDGNVYHKWNILPVLIIGVVCGVIAGVVITKNLMK